jgi:hypothetical protein
MNIMNPTGKGVRSDSGGVGSYGASRKKTLPNGKVQSYPHAGTDLICTPGQDILMPFTGRILRVARPYENDLKYSGIYISGKMMDVKMFYLEPIPDLIGEVVKQGAVIGHAQDIGRKYQGVTPHIHFEIVKCNPEIFLDFSG